MKQREVTDKENIRWTCVQTYTMSEHNTEENEQVFSRTEGDKVAVVCTPSGKEKTVRLDVPQKWEDELTDDSLLQMIQDSKE